MMNNLINLIGSKRILVSSECFHNERSEHGNCNKIDKYIVVITNTYCEIIPICNLHLKEYAGFFVRMETKERNLENFYKIYPADDEIINMILVHKQ